MLISLVGIGPAAAISLMPVIAMLPHAVLLCHYLCPPLGGVVGRQETVPPPGSQGMLRPLEGMVAAAAILLMPVTGLLPHVVLLCHPSSPSLGDVTGRASVRARRYGEDAAACWSIERALVVVIEARGTAAAAKLLEPISSFCVYETVLLVTSDAVVVGGSLLLSRLVMVEVAAEVYEAVCSVRLLLVCHRQLTAMTITFVDSCIGCISMWLSSVCWLLRSVVEESV